VPSTSTDLPPLAGEAGITRDPCVTQDPFAAFDDLMVVVEALCPTWPAREITTAPAAFKL